MPPAGAGAGRGARAGRLPGATASCLGRHRAARGRPGAAGLRVARRRWGELEFWAQRHYGDTVSNVDWLHLPLSSLTTLSNVVIFVGLVWSSGQLAPAGRGGAGKPKAAARPAEDDAPS